MTALLVLVLFACITIIILQWCAIRRLNELNDGLELQLVRAHETASGLMFELDEFKDIQDASDYR